MSINKKSDKMQWSVLLISTIKFAFCAAPHSLGDFVQQFADCVIILYAKDAHTKKQLVFYAIIQSKR